MDEKGHGQERGPADDRALALLLGCAVGDALGVPVEFRERGTFRVTGMQGYGTHNQPPGTWSDDTSLTLALADTLPPDGSDLEPVARAFRHWYRDAWYTAHGHVFDIGNATARAIRRLEAGVAPEKAGGTDDWDNGNGSLMRVAPLTFHPRGRSDRTERFDLVRRVSSVTHAHPLSVTACFIYVEMLDRIREGLDAKRAYADLKDACARDAPFPAGNTSARFDRILKGDITRLGMDDIRSTGFVVDTLEAALWCFLTTDNYADAVLKAVNLGDDTDTTGAVTGALAGLAYGTAGIPAEWIDRLAGYGEIRRVALKLSAWSRPRDTKSTV